MSKFHLGINMGHDRSAAVVQDGRVVVAIEQERLDRVKHSVGFMLQSPDQMGQIQVPGESIAYCLNYLELPLSAMSTITANMPGVDMAPQIMRSKFSDELASHVRQVPSHHLAHAYSAFWPSGFDEALVLVVDASGSTISDKYGRHTESYTLYEGRGTKLTELHSETVQSHLTTLSTLGFVYEAVARKAGFVTQLNSGLSFAEAGKLMGLAAYGGPQPNWNRWFHKDLNSRSIRISAYDIFLEMTALEKRYNSGQGKPYFRPWLVDLAWKVQNELEQVLCALVEEAAKQTGLTHLCLAGGIALNSVANYQILTRCKLDDIFVFPAAGDNGISAGCALWAYHTQESGTARPALRSACFGRPYSSEEIDRAVDGFGDLLKVEQFEFADMTHRVADALVKGHVVARYEGGSEFGPRALGHRSILADPTYERMKDVLNARVKFREAFRPFAPFVPLERAADVFELGSESPYMLLVAPVREELKSLLPSITHADGTGRVQTCTEQDNAFFHALCLEAEKRRGVAPVLLNTSFNVAGQPIVETPQEAIETFLRTDIDYLALEDRWIRRRHQSVREYDRHVFNLPVEKLPRGLDAQQPSVVPLMTELDAALFDHDGSRHWTESELASIADHGGLLKETSLLFGKSPFLVPLETQLSPQTTIVLNPGGNSVLVDETGRQAKVQLTLRQLEVLLAVRHDPRSLREELRLKLCATPAEFDEMIAEVTSVLEQFQIAVHNGWLDTDHRSLIDLSGLKSRQTLDSFHSSDFNIEYELRQIRQTILNAGYAEKTICRLLSVDSLQSIEPTRLHYYDTHLLPETPLSDLVRLFQLRASVPRKRVENLFDENQRHCLVTMGILIEQEHHFRGGVDLFCSGGLLIATDHRYMIFEDDRLDEDPVMYIGMDSHGLVQTAPRQICDALLDLCCGSGIQGLVAGRYARKIVAVDVNPRAIRFSRFNAQLNGIRNYEARQGDLYEAVKDQTFDCILANPPFVPSPEEKFRFRDGGTTGERILQEIVRGAEQHLSPDGRLCVVTDLVNPETYEQKLKNWLNEAAAHALILSTADRDEILFSVPHCHAPFSQSLEDYHAELDRWIQNFRDENLQNVNFGYILVWLNARCSGSDITTRTIHNPAEPVWEHVQEWIEQRRLWDSREAESMVLSVHSQLRLVATQSLSRRETDYELRFPGNPFFTTYEITAGIADELERFERTAPVLSQYSEEFERSWIEKLHRLGILQLKSYQQNAASSPTTDSRKTDMSVEQSATKTTPTCLSSYLG
ncbi:MAG: methyltransferase [Fuerstiella sp.]|nr:methyltransferase [Fuerstiella sp.]